MSAKHQLIMLLLIMIIIIASCSILIDDEWYQYYGNRDLIFEDDHIYCTAEISRYENLYEFNEGFAFYVIDINKGIIYDTIIEGSMIWPHLCKTQDYIYLSMNIEDYSLMENLKYNIESQDLNKLDNNIIAVQNLEISPNGQEYVYMKENDIESIFYYNVITNEEKSFNDISMDQRFKVNWNTRKIAGITNYYDDQQLIIVNIDAGETDKYILTGKTINDKTIRDIGYTKWLDDNIVGDVRYTDNTFSLFKISVSDSTIILDTLNIRSIFYQNNGYYCEYSSSLELIIYDNNNNLINIVNLD